MLCLGTERAEELTALLHSPGGFAWWYVDLVDSEGRALVLLWSFGLPFLPGSRRTHKPTDRPSVSLALYEGGRSTFYLLQTYGPEQAEQEGPGRFRIGDSHFTLRSAHGTVTLDAELDLPIPSGGRMIGSVHARGAACQLSEAHEPTSTHRWAPILSAASGEARLRAGQAAPFELSGRVYADSNGSREPLHALGIACWRWGRVALPGRELIYYVVDPADSESAPVQWVLEALPDGSVRRHQAELCWSGARRSVYGLGFHDRLALSSASGLALTLRFSALVDDGPFYLRFLVEAETPDGERGHGLAEQVAPARVDLPVQRPFVRMRTHATDAPNSIWLPLFSGPREGRVRRLLTGLLNGGMPAGSTP